MLEGKATAGRNAFEAFPHGQPGSGVVHILRIGGFGSLPGESAGKRTLDKRPLQPQGRLKGLRGSGDGRPPRNGNY